MSNEYYVRNTNESYIKSDKIIGKLDQSDSNGSLPRSVIEWSEEISNELLQFFTKCNYPYRHIREIPFQEPLLGEIRRFFISLDAYIESSNPVVPEKDILYGSTMLDYAETLKRIKRKSFETTWKARNFSDPDWWEDIPAYIIKDIGDIFNYSYLIFWKQKDPDDYLHGFSDVNINKITLSKFKSAISDLLPERDSFQKIDQLEVLTTISSSVAYDSKQDKKSPHYLLKPKKLNFSKSFSKARRSIIHVSPNNVRDSVILDPSDLNTISLIDKQIMEILSKMKGHIHLKNKDRVSKRLRYLSDNFTLFIQRDIRKEGITKPRELLKAMLEVLYDSYPDIEIFQNTSFYDSFCYLDNDNKLLSPQRGHGLGMANTLTTLMQLAIHHMIVDELLDDIPELNTMCIVLNDDFTAGFDDDYHLESYWDKEDEILEGLSIIRAPEKSFVTQWYFVIAERYITPFGEHPKESYQRRELLLPLTCYNIVHAKEYFLAAQTYTDNKFHRLYLNEIRIHWGYEFYPEEFNYPSFVGGWLNDYIGGINMGLVTLDELPYKSYVARGFNASNYRPSVRNRGEMYKSPLFLLYGEPEIPEEFQEHFDILSTHEISWKYGRLLANSNKEFILYWDKYKKKRKELFKQNSFFTYEELLINIVNRYQTTQFYPNDSMTIRYHKGNYIQVSICDPYIDPNAKIACLSKYNDTAYNFKETFSIRFTNKDEFTKKRSDLLSKEAQRSTKSEDLNNLLIGSYDEIYYPTDFKPEEQYFNPIGIGRATALLNWGKGYPEIREIFRTSLLNEKREIFGRFLSIEELNFVTRYNVSRNLIKTILDFDINQDLCSTIEYLCQCITDKDPPMRPDTPDSDEEPERDEFLIVMSDLLEEGIPKLWNYRHDSESYRFFDENIRWHVGQLTNLIVILTFPHLYTDAARQYELDRYASSSHISRAILSRSGLEKLMNPEDFFCGGLDSDDLGFGLFDEG